MHARAALLVEQPAPELGQQLRVGLVPAEHPGLQRAPLIAGQHVGAAARLAGRQHDVLHGDAEFGQGGPHLVHRGPPARRSEGQVHDGGDGPAQSHRGQHVVELRGAEIHGGQEHEEDQRLAEPAHRPGQVGRSDRDDGHDDGHPGGRELGPDVLDGDEHVHAAPERRPVHQSGDEPGQRPGECAAQEQVTGQSMATPDQRGHDDQAQRPQRAQGVEQPDDRVEGVGQVVQRVEQVDLGLALVVLVGQHDEDHCEPHRQAYPVAGAAPVRLLGSRAERALARPRPSRAGLSLRDRRLAELHPSSEPGRRRPGITRKVSSVLRFVARLQRYSGQTGHKSVSC